jgi:hypothetical protein
MLRHVGVRSKNRHDLRRLHRFARMRCPMDLSFSLRRRTAPVDMTLALASLLSETAARSAVTPTAKVQARLETAKHADDADPRVAIFSGDRKSVSRVHSFGEIAQTAVTSGQQT